MAGLPRIFNAWHAALFCSDAALLGAIRRAATGREIRGGKRTASRGLIPGLERGQEHQEPKELCESAEPKLLSPARLTPSSVPLPVPGLRVAPTCGPLRLRAPRGEGMLRTELLTSIAIGAGADNALALTAVELPIAVPHSRPERQKKLDSIVRDADDLRAVSED